MKLARMQEFLRQLFRARLDLLKTNNIGIQLVESLQKSIAPARSEAVDIPAGKFKRHSDFDLFSRDTHIVVKKYQSCKFLFLQHHGRTR